MVDLRGGREPHRLENPYRMGQPRSWRSGEVLASVTRVSQTTIRTRKAVIRHHRDGDGREAGRGGRRPTRLSPPLGGSRKGYAEWCRVPLSSSETPHESSCAETPFTLRAGRHPASHGLSVAGLTSGPWDSSV